MLGPQRDFGGFDSRFLGVSLNVDSEETWELLRDHVFGSESIADHLPSGRELETVATLTSLGHELRHFHDFILSPAGGAVMITRLATFLSAAQLMVALEVGGTLRGVTHIPVPLRTWWRKTIDEQDSDERNWNAVALRRGKRPISVLKLSLTNPSASLDERRTEYAPLGPEIIPRMIDVIDSYYVRLEQYIVGAPLTSPGGIRLENRHIAEASAVITQIQSAYSWIGADAAKLILDGAVNQPASVYGRALNLAMEAFRLSGIIDDFVDVRPLAALFNWSLIGAYQSRDVSGSPCRRFARLVGGALQGEGLLFNTNIRDCYAEWDRRAGEPNTLEDLERSLEVDAMYVAKLDKLKENPDAFAKPFVNLLATWFAIFAAARKGLVEAFLESPSDYVFPLEYQKRLVDLPAAPIKLRFSEESSLGGIRADLEAEGWLLNWFGLYSDDDPEVLVREACSPTQTAGIEVIPCREALEIQGFLTMSDVVFSHLRFMVSDLDKQLASNVLGAGVGFIDLFPENLQSSK